MSSCFQSTRWIRNGSLAAGAAIAAWFVLAGGESHLVVRILYGVMIFALVGVVGFGIAQFRSMRLMNQALALLNQELEPARFLHAFTPAAARCRKDTIQGVMAWVYVSAGYMAQGDAEKALGVLDGLHPEQMKSRGLAAEGLVLNQKFQCQYALGDTEGAARTLERLGELAREMAKRQPSAAKNLSYNVHLFGEYLRFAGEGEADTAYLEEEIRLSANRLHRQQVRMVLADIYRAMGRREDELRLLREVSREGGGLACREEALRRLKASDIGEEVEG